MFKKICTVLVLSLSLLSCDTRDKDWVAYIKKQHCEDPIKVERTVIPSTCNGRYTSYPCDQIQYTKTYKCNDGYIYTRVVN